MVLERDLVLFVPSGVVQHSAEGMTRARGWGWTFFVAGVVGS